MARENSWPLRIAPLILLLCMPASVFAQASSAVALSVIGNVPNHLDLSIADLAKFQRQTIRVTDEKGNPAEYGGVPVAKILEKAGAPLGKELKGPNMALGVIARAPDGYTVLFSLTEFDPPLGTASSSWPTVATASPSTVAKVLCES